jgi:2-keto-3-deoxy-L-rhamnonate aldolase RhmA
LEQIKNLFHHGQGKPVGVHATDGAVARRYRDAGCTLITTAVDATAIARDTAAQLRLARA